MANISLKWRHNERDGVSDYQPRDCLLNRLFGRKSKKMFPSDDVIMSYKEYIVEYLIQFHYSTDS